MPIMDQFKAKLKLKSVKDRQKYYASMPPSEAAYRRAAASLAISYAPDIYPCGECSWPHISGYCCTYCGSSEPSRRDREREAE